MVLTWFFNDYHDFISTRTTDEGQTIFDNVYNNHTQGLELDIIWQFNQFWSIRAEYTYIIDSTTDAPDSFTFSKPEELAPTHYGDFVINYNIDQWNWNISAVWHDGISVLQDKDALIVLNSKLQYQFDRRWKISANVRNLLDKDYFTPRNQPLGSDQLGNIIQEMPSRGREFILTIEYQWDKD